MSKSPYTTFSTYLDLSLREAVQARAKTQGVTVRSIVEDALRSHLAAAQAPVAPVEPEEPVTPKLARMTPTERLEHAADVVAYLQSQCALVIEVRDRKREVTYSPYARGDAGLHISDCTIDDLKGLEKLVIRVVI